MELKIALIQMQIWDGEKEKNFLNALNLIEQLSKSEDPPDIVCLPELFTTGYDLRNVEKYAEIFPGDTMKRISEISKGKFLIIGTILESENNNFYNSAFILDKKGKLLGKYRKTHLFSPMLEKEFLTQGDKIKTFIIPSLNNLKVGIAICYDLRFPEVFRSMALEGAQIIFVPSEFPSPKRKIWKTLLRARAIENQIYTVGINRVGKGKSDEFFGYSMVTNGDTLAHLGTEPMVKTFTIDLDTLDLLRQKIPLLKDRRADLFDK